MSNRLQHLNHLYLKLILFQLWTPAGVRIHPSGFVGNLNLKVPPAPRDWLLADWEKSEPSRGRKEHLLWQQGATNLLNQTQHPQQKKHKKQKTKRKKIAKSWENPITKMNLCTSQKQQANTLQRSEKKILVLRDASWMENKIRMLLPVDEKWKTFASSVWILLFHFIPSVDCVRVCLLFSLFSALSSCKLNCRSKN